MRFAPMIISAVAMMGITDRSSIFDDAMPRYRPKQRLARNVNTSREEERRRKQQEKKRKKDE